MKVFSTADARDRVYVPLVHNPSRASSTCEQHVGPMSGRSRQHNLVRGRPDMTCQADLVVRLV